jgi:DNA polymerase-3 subunit epsilon
MYLIFDTETNGLPQNWKAAPSANNNWPRIVSLSWQLYNLNEEKISEQDFIIRPVDFNIPPEATKVHGITEEIAWDKGVPLKIALVEFQEALLCSEVIIAHNIAFDRAVVLSEYLRRGFFKDKNISTGFPGKKEYCTMQASTDLCKIPHKNGHGYKWPQLQELYYHLFERKFANAHNSLADVQACAECYFSLQKTENIYR